MSEEEEQSVHEKQKQDPVVILQENLIKENYINNNNNTYNDNIININKAKTIKFSDNLRLNITIIGKRKCGKSALIKSYLKKSFEYDNIDTTLDIFGKNILIYGQKVSLVISEVSQDKSNFQLAKEILSASHIIFICYSLEDDLKKGKEDIIEGSISLIETVDKDIPIFIVGCKFDLIKEEIIDTIKIFEEDDLTHNGKNVQDHINVRRETFNKNFCGFYITSSLLNLNIQELFNDAIKTVAIPYVKLYQKKIKYFEMQLENQKMEMNKKKKGAVNENIEQTININVEENGCFIF